MFKDFHCSNVHGLFIYREKYGATKNEEVARAHSYIYVDGIFICEHAIKIKLLIIKIIKNISGFYRQPLKVDCWDSKLSLPQHGWGRQLISRQSETRKWQLDSEWEMTSLWRSS